VRPLPSSPSRRRDLRELLRADVDAVAATMVQAIEARVPVYRQWRELGHGDELAEAIRVTLVEFLDYLDSGRSRSASRVFDIGRARAQQGLPAEAILHAWRVAGDAVWQWLITAAPGSFGPGGDAVSFYSRYLEFADQYVAAVTDSFLEGQSEARTAELLASRSVVDDVIQGLPPEQTEQALRRIRMPAERVVVVVCSTDRAGPDATAELVADYGGLLRRLRVAARIPIPWSMRAGRLVAIVPAGVEIMSPSLADLGDGLRIGISSVTPARSDLSIARHQAEQAREATSAARPCVDMNTLSLVQIAALRTSLRWEDLPEWLRRFLVEDRKHAGEWMATAGALLATQANVGAAARALSLHPNSVYYRLAAVRSSCDVDLRDPRVLADVVLARASREFGRLQLP
jgi:hypothetical protein